MNSNSTRYSDKFSALVLFIAMLIAAGRLQATDWVLHLGYVGILASFGVILGLLLGISSFSRLGVFWLATGYSIVIVPWQLSNVTEGVATYGERLIGLGGRLIFSFAQLSSNQRVDDYILFLSFACVMFWLISIYAGYSLTRKGNILAAVIPSGIVILLIHTYDSAVASRLGFLGFYLFFVLLLIGKHTYIDNQIDWKKRRVFVAIETQTDITVAILISTLVLMLVAWNLPLSATPLATARQTWNSFIKPWDLFKHKVSDAFAAIQGVRSAPVNDLYGDTLGLGQGSVYNDDVIFVVTIPDQTRSFPRFYWRGMSYDEYDTQSGWKTTAVKQGQFKPENENLLALAGVNNSTSADFRVTTYIPNQTLLYTFSNPVQVSRVSDYKYFPVQDNQIDIVSLHANPGLRPGESYTARSLFINPSIRQIQQAGENYPDWVRQRYLQLPSNFSPRILQLAKEVTSGKVTPYDKASAITDYLRQNIKYSLTIDAPPPNKDKMEWFLFDYKKGFCNYYATAEVLMLRAVGIPSRIVVGYAQGSLDQDGANFYVRNKDAHAWPEVYFPDIGWVQFEPTTSQLDILRPLGIDLGNLDEEGNPRRDGLTDNIPPVNTDALHNTNLDDPSNNLSNFFRILAWVIIIIAFTALAGYLSWRAFRHELAPQKAPAALITFLENRQWPVPQFLQNWMYWSEQTTIARSFEAINQSLRWLGKTPKITATPAERAQTLRELVPAATAEIDILLAEHQTDLYSSREGINTIARRAAMRVRLLTIRKRFEKYF